MALTPAEVGMIALALFVLILFFKPSIIPNMAKSIGRMYSEYRKEAGSQIREEVSKLAEALHIPVEGRTEEEVMEEIRRKLKTAA